VGKGKGNKELHYNAKVEEEREKLLEVEEVEMRGKEVFEWIPIMQGFCLLLLF
jgi:hypothetical protein